jgi:hypothetical protein
MKVARWIVDCDMVSVLPKLSLIFAPCCGMQLRLTPSSRECVMKDSHNINKRMYQGVLTHSKINTQPAIDKKRRTSYVMYNNILFYFTFLVAIVISTIFFICNWFLKTVDINIIT